MEQKKAQYLIQMLPQTHKRKYLSRVLIQKPHQPFDHQLLPFEQVMLDLVQVKTHLLNMPKLI